MQFIEGKGLDEVLVTWRRRSAPEPAPGNQPSAAAAPAEGLTLQSLLEEHQPQGDRHWRLVARIGMQVAEALHHAHQQGTLHRDVKPGNLLLDPHGKPWVTDFGLAKVIECQGLTSTGEIIGTLTYLAPEVFQGRTDARSDLYSLGLTLYELLT